MENISDWASIIGLIVSIISLVLLKNIYTKISIITNIDANKGNNEQTAVGKSNKQKIQIK